MIGYKVEEKVAKALEKGKEKHKYGQNFNPVQDINGDWFIFDKEADYCALNFKFEFVETEFVAPPQEPIE